MRNFIVNLVRKLLLPSRGSLEAKPNVGSIFVFVSFVMPHRATRNYDQIKPLGGPHIEVTLAKLDVDVGKHYLKNECIANEAYV